MAVAWTIVRSTQFRVLFSLSHKATQEIQCCLQGDTVPPVTPILRQIQELCNFRSHIRLSEIVQLYMLLYTPLISREDPRRRPFGLSDQYWQVWIMLFQDWIC